MSATEKGRKPWATGPSYPLFSKNERLAISIIISVSSLH